MLQIKTLPAKLDILIYTDENKVFQVVSPFYLVLFTRLYFYYTSGS